MFFLGKNYSVYHSFKTKFYEFDENEMKIF